MLVKTLGKQCSTSAILIYYQGAGAGSANSRPPLDHRTAENGPMTRPNSINCWRAIQPSRGEVEMKLFAAIIVLALLPVSASAQFLSGNDLYDRCSNSTDAGPYTFCLGFVAGLNDALVMTNDICPTANVTLLQSVDIVRQYLREHPAQRHYTASSAGAMGLMAAFPCKGNATTTGAQ
jgi:Rap1a immunity proteins